MKTHYMRLNARPFEELKSGEKTVEVRLNDEKRQKLRIGDKIEFLKRPDLAEKLLVEVVELISCKTFGELYDLLGERHFRNWNREDFISSTYVNYYPKEKEEKYGALGIRIQVLESKK